MVGEGDEVEPTLNGVGKLLLLVMEIQRRVLILGVSGSEREGRRALSGHGVKERLDADRHFFQ